MHQRVRERLPRLPELVDTTEGHHAEQQHLLTAAEATPVGETFEQEGRQYRRIDRKDDETRKRFHYRPTIVLVQDLATGEQLDLTRSEDEAFGAWRPSRRSGTPGSASKNSWNLPPWLWCLTSSPTPARSFLFCRSCPPRATRNGLLVSPELASVLATIISRLRGDNEGVVPLVARYDPHELVTGPVLPHLFQRSAPPTHLTQADG
ncbi:hypothetical protein AB0I68_35175 [Streptomyces sp. NPDC050448]|uniref:hypothetical protein n=1 Tax=Streptomyces sp. NPDC050448 TaxID=3155404 RepID=UPI0034270534